VWSHRVVIPAVYTEFVIVIDHTTNTLVDIETRGFFGTIVLTSYPEWVHNRKQFSGAVSKMLSSLKKRQRFWRMFSEGSPFK